MAPLVRLELNSCASKELFKPRPGGSKKELETEKDNSSISIGTFHFDEVAHDYDTGYQQKRVLVLCTGGTLCMAPDPSNGNSLATVKGTFTNYIKAMPELVDNPKMPHIVACESSELIDSSNMGPRDWKALARSIRQYYGSFDGFVILTGTDTMAYAASALSFMFANLAKPIIFTGSQIPLIEPNNDARNNFLTAVQLAASDATPREVTICFHDRLVRGCRATKVDSESLLAFGSPNLEPLAKIGINVRGKQHLFLPPNHGRLELQEEMDTRYFVLNIEPKTDYDIEVQIIQGLQQGGTTRALVLRLFGQGNLPSMHSNLLDAIKDASDNGVLVVATSQCHSGCVHLGHYAVGRDLVKAGVASAGDMTLEATVTKLAHLMGRNDLSPSEIRRMMEVDLRGERSVMVD